MCRRTEKGRLVTSWLPPSLSSSPSFLFGLEGGPQISKRLTSRLRSRRPRSEATRYGRDRDGEGSV